MASIFEKLWRLGPAAFVAKAIIAAIAADALLLAFILVRRMYRKSYFVKRDNRAFEFRQKWDMLISGQLPYEMWRKNPFDRRIVEAMALDGLERADREESARILRFLRTSGLIDKGVNDARNHRGWRRRRALVALGRTRAPEGIPALSEGLRDRDTETRLAALRGLGRTASPKAAEEILNWVSEMGLCVPALPLQNALIQCAAERPQLLLPYLRHAEGPVREVLGRVLGEVASPALGAELLPFAKDDLDELRAAAARAISHAQPRLALETLRGLAKDPVWFVRLRAFVSLGQIRNPEAIPTLLLGLTDANRLVRLRAAEALVLFETELASVFEQAVATGDRYGVHAFLTAVENADLRAKLEEELETTIRIPGEQKQELLKVLRRGSLPTEEPEVVESVSDGAFLRP